MPGPGRCARLALPEAAPGRASPTPTPEPRTRSSPFPIATFRAYLELARLSNAPTCVTNVLVGAATVTAVDASAGTRSVVVAGAGVVMLYVAGMALNDLVDLEVDRAERPGRPLPSGRVSVHGARRLTASCLAVGWGLLAVPGWPALRLATALVIAIVLYDLLHRAVAASVVLMGLCRGLVYAVAAAAVLRDDASGLPWSVLLWPAGAMTAYIIAISVVARGEMASRPSRRLWPLILLPLIAVAPLVALRPSSWIAPTVAGAAVVAWLVVSSRRLAASPPRVKDAVLGWLAGICLIDGFWLTLLGRETMAAVAGACFIVTVVAHRRIAGT